MLLFAYYARDLKNRASESALGNTGKFFIIDTKAIVHEAQDALLKLFEEPTVGTHFFFILPNSEILKDTFRSRFQIVRRGQGAIVTKNALHPALRDRILHEARHVL